MTAGAPSTPDPAQVKSISSEQMGMSYQAYSSKQLCISEQAQKPVLQEQENIHHKANVQAQTVSDDDRYKGMLTGSVSLYARQYR